MTSEPQPSPATGVVANRNLVIVLVVIATAGLIASCIFAYLLFFRNAEPIIDEEQPTRIVPTAVSEANIDRPVLLGTTNSDTLSVTLELPVSLQLGTRDYVVQTQNVALGGSWVAPTLGEGTAVWIYGTIINYVVGLPNSEENRTLLEQLELGQEIRLTTETGVPLSFAVDNREIVPSANQTIFAQNRPGITVVLLGMPGGERLVVHGTYIIPEAAESVNLGNVVELGEPAQLENLQITVSGASYIPDRPEAPPGFAFYTIDYQIQNTGLTAFDSSRLQLLLVDQFGTQYVRSPQASQLGNFPPMSGFINSGQIIQASVGYQVPIGLVSDSLNWIIRHLDQGSEIQVNIPFSAGGSAAQGSVITLRTAAASADLTSLILEGSVTNAGEQPLIISERDVSLMTSDGAVYLLLSTNPAFPWNVSPGQTGQFAVTFQRPLSNDSAVFTVLNQPFQLNNLR